MNVAEGSQAGHTHIGTNTGIFACLEIELESSSNVNGKRQKEKQNASRLYIGTFAAAEQSKSNVFVAHVPCHLRHMAQRLRGERQRQRRRQRQES